MRVIFFPIIFWLRKSTKIKDFQNRKPRPKIKINTLLVLIITSISSLAYSKEYTEILIDSKTGNILHQYNALAFNYPASLTKLMTLYLTFESLNNGKLSLDQELTISRRAAKQPRSNIRLKENETITVRQAILAVIIKSANDAAVVLSEANSESEWFFTDLMNRKAKSIGMYDTHFRNASGLHHDDQFSTAKDMAILAFHIKAEFPEYFDLFSKTAFRYQKRLYTTHNHLLVKYKTVNGIKTGYTRKSGFNLISSAIYKENEIIGVIMGAKSSQIRDRNMMRLLKRKLYSMHSFVSNTSSENSIKAKRITKASIGTFFPYPEPQKKPQKNDFELQILDTKKNLFYIKGDIVIPTPSQKPI